MYASNYYEWQIQGSIRSANETVPVVLEYVQPSSVIDVGCGAGVWLSAFREYGVEELLGVDSGSPDGRQLRIPEDCFISHDLRKPLELGRRFDLVVSLETAEHLPVECAKRFVDTLVGLGPIVLFSAAIPHQGGYGHLNEQWPDYWARYFAAKGYDAIDCIRPRIWDNENVEWWYAQNMLIFANRTAIERCPKLKKAYEATEPSRLSIVHPRQYLGYITSVGR